MIGRPKAAVLPEPVWAMATMSRPARCGGIACAWIGFGVTMPAAAADLRSGPEIPSAAKPDAPALSLIVTVELSHGRAQPAAI
jgi:hypothetical protein